MHYKDILRILACLVLSGFMTGGVFYWNFQSTQSDRIRSALTLANQVVFQTQSLSYYAQEKQEPDPIGWAIHFLNSGMGSRSLQIFLYKGDIDTPNGEKFNLNPNNNIFSFYKTLKPETGEGIRVDIQLRYNGFLGSHSRLTSDLWLVSFFLLLAALFIGKTRSLFDFKEGPKNSSLEDHEPSIGIEPITRKEIPNTDESLHRVVSEWQVRAKDDLIQLGLRVKEMTFSAKNLATSSAKIFESFENEQTAKSECKALLSHTKQMNQSISHTTESLMKMAKIFQELNDRTKSKD